MRPAVRAEARRFRRQHPQRTTAERHAKLLRLAAGCIEPRVNRLETLDLAAVSFEEEVLRKA